MFEAILCDMDGTLIDTEYANAIAYCEALNKYGVNIDVHEFIDRYLGMSWREFIPLICPLIDEDTAADIARDKKLIYKNKLSLTSVNLNVIQMIGILKESKKVALVTTASREAVDDLLRYHKLSYLFDLCVTGDDVVEAKPSPEPYLKAANILSVDIQNCIILEDSEIGIRSARQSGATVLVVDHE